jgi:hypothetical protein
LDIWDFFRHIGITAPVEKILRTALFTITTSISQNMVICQWLAVSQLPRRFSFEYRSVEKQWERGGTVEESGVADQLFASAFGIGSNLLPRATERWLCVRDCIDTNKSRYFA